MPGEPLVLKMLEELIGLTLSKTLSLFKCQGPDCEEAAVLCKKALEAFVVIQKELSSNEAFAKSSEEVWSYCVGSTLLFWYRRAQIVNASTLLFLKP